MGKKRIRLAGLAATAPAVIIGITACGPATPPPPPISLNQISETFAKYPRCDSSIPACKVSQEEAFTNGLNQANTLLSTRDVAGFTLRIDKIEQSEKGGWDVRGKVTWDLGDENASAATGVGMVMGIATMLGGGTALDGIGTAASIAKDSYKEIGKCLTSTQLTDTPATQVSVAIKNISIPDLNGVKDGAFILVKGTSILGFKPGVGIFDDPASTFSTPTQNGFGEMNIAAHGGSASFAGEKVPTKEFCKSKTKSN